MDVIETKPSWEIKIKSIFIKTGTKLCYTYDFGDGWEHDVEFEEIIEKEIIKPICVSGKRCCPPEDVGGPGGYENFCKTMKSKRGKEYKEMMEWFGDDYDPEEFNVNEVEFDNPKTRLKEMLGN